MRGKILYTASAILLLIRPLGEREGAHVLQDRVSPGPHRPSCYPMGVQYPPRMASLMGVVAHFGVHIRWVLLPTRSFDKPAAG